MVEHTQSTNDNVDTVVTGIFAHTCGISAAEFQLFHCFLFAESRNTRIDMNIRSHCNDMQQPQQL